MLATILYLHVYDINTGFSEGSVGKESACNARDVFDPWMGKIPWRRKWHSTLIFLPGESHGQRKLGGLQSIGSQRVRHDLVT